MPGVLATRLLAVHAALDRATVPHAFGGAIALAYWTLDPRATSDLDLNVFVTHVAPAVVLDALPEEVTHDAEDAAAIERDGQVRVWWDQTPVDLFFDTLDVHRQAAENVRVVPFAGRTIPVLGPEELVVFKAMFDRTKDWADIEAVVAADTVDLTVVRRTLGTLLSADDARFGRLDEAVRRAAEDELR